MPFSDEQIEYLKATDPNIVREALGKMTDAQRSELSSAIDAYHARKAPGLQVMGAPSGIPGQGESPQLVEGVPNATPGGGLPNNNIGENDSEIGKPSMLQNVVAESGYYGGPEKAFAANAAKGLIQSTVHGIPISVAKASNTINRLNTMAGNAIAKGVGVPQKYIDQSTAGNQEALNVGNDIIASHQRGIEAENKLVPATSAIGKAGEYTGEIAGGTAKAMAAGPAALPAFAAETFGTSFDDEINKDPSNPLKAVAVASSKAALTAGMMGLPGKDAFGNLAKLIGYKLVRGTALGAAWGLGDAAIDQVVGGQNLTSKDYLDRAKDSIKTMLGYELSGVIPVAKLIKPAKAVAESFTSPEDARNSIAPKLSQAQSEYIDFVSKADIHDPEAVKQANALKDKANELFEQMQAVAYAEKAGIKFKELNKPQERFGQEEPHPSSVNAELEGPRYTSDNLVGLKGKELNAIGEEFGLTFSQKTPKKERVQAILNEQAKGLQPVIYNTPGQAELLNPIKPNIEPRLTQEEMKRQLGKHLEENGKPVQLTVQKEMSPGELDAQRVIQAKQREIEDKYLRDLEEENAQQEPRTGKEISPTPEGGKDLSQDRSGVRPGEQGEEASRKGEAQKEVAFRHPVEIVNSTTYQGIRQGSLMGPSDEQLVARDPATGKDIGKLWITKMNGGFEVRKIETDPSYRGKDVATQLYLDAREKFGPYVSSTDFTDMGKRFNSGLRERFPHVFEFDKSKPLEGLRVELSDAGLPQHQVDAWVNHAKLDIEDGTSPSRATDAVRDFFGMPTEKGHGPTADMLGFQQIYEKGMNIAKARLGLDSKASDIDVIKAVASKVGSLASTVKATAMKILSKIPDIGRALAEKIAGFLHNRTGEMGAVSFGGIKPRLHRENKLLKTESISSKLTDLPRAEDRVRSLFPGDENKALRKAIYDSGIHRQSNSDIAIKEMARQISKPSQRMAGNAIKGSVAKIGDAFKPVKDTLAPSTASPSAQRAADVFSWGKSTGAQKLSIVKNAVMPALRILDRSPKSLQDLVVDAVENPNLRSSIKDPRLSEFVSNMKDLQDSLWQAIKDRGGEMGYEDDYLHHAFKNPKEAKEILKKARMEGNLGYMKERTGPSTYALAREIPGLEPRETNAARIILEDAANKIKYIYTHDILTKARDEGLLLDGVKSKNKEGGSIETAPPGMVPVSRDISIAMSRTKSDKGVTYYAYPEVAKIINNHLQPGFEGNVAYGAARFVNNSMNQVELGLSAFHGAVISNEIAASMIGTGIKNALAGKPVEGLKQVATGLTPVLAQVKVYREGSKLVKALESGKELPDALGGKGFQDYFNKGGARTSMDAEYVNNNIDRLRQAWGQMTDKEQTLWVRGKGGARVAVRIPFATIEAAMKPIMEYYVPRAKVAMFKRMYDVVKDSIPKDATDAEISRRARRDWDQIENAFGQLTYDNLHWNKMFKQSMMLGIRAVGWKLGSKRAIYGAAVDLGKAVPMGLKEISRSLHLSKSSEATLAKEAAAARSRGDFEPGSAITNRMAWAIGQAMITTLVASAVMGGRAVNKKRKDEELTKEDLPVGMDAIYPRTGEKNALGEEKRIAMASYMREGVDDYLSWKDLIQHGSTKGFQDQIKSARSPLASWGMELATGKDWRGAQIENQAANLGSKFIPIGGSKLIQERNKGNTWAGSAKEAGIQMAGFLRPKASHLQTDAQRKIYELWGEKYKQNQTSSEVEENMRAKGLAEQEAQGRDVRKELEELSPNARKRANLSPKSAAMLYMVKKFDYKDLRDVFENYANKEEKRALDQVLNSAFRRSLLKTPTSKRNSAESEHAEFMQKIRQSAP